jgi:hypothetical protein
MEGRCFGRRWGFLGEMTVIKDSRWWSRKKWSDTATGGGRDAVTISDPSPSSHSLWLAKS